LHTSREAALAPFYLNKTGPCPHDSNCHGLQLVETTTMAGEGQTAIGEGIWTAIGQAHAQSRDGARGAARAR
jgi:hypothetical protein